MEPRKRRADRPTRQKAARIEIREMELDDLPAVYALGEKLFTAERWPNLYRTWDEYELVDFFSSDGEFCLVAETDDQIVGFVLGSLIEKRRSAWTYGWLVWVGIDPEVNRRGIGTRLLNQLTEQFIEDGARMMIVDTETENKEALQFFRKHGFGDEIEHVYLSRNLTTHPEYLRRRAVKSKT
jgi:ribosomal protein S18 acetylase RimI-like enzyme